MAFLCKNPAGLDSAIFCFRVTARKQSVAPESSLQRAAAASLQPQWDEMVPGGSQRGTVTLQPQPPLSFSAVACLVTEEVALEAKRRHTGSDVMTLQPRYGTAARRA